MSTKSKPTGKPKSRQPAQLANANRGQEELAALNRVRAFDLRIQRNTHREIAAALGVSVSTAFGYINQQWDQVKATTIEKVEMLRAIELETLDALERRWLALALHSDLDVSTNKGRVHIELPAYDAGLKALDRVLKIHERRAKLLGLDMPEKLEHSGKVEHKHMTLAEFRERLARA